MSVEPSPPRPSTQIRKLCILIVHADRLVRQALQERFDQESTLTYSVEITDNAAEGLAIIRSLHQGRLPVALILAQDPLPDLALPDFFRQAEAIDSEIRKIIVLTRQPEARQLAEMADLAHFDGFLLEPETYAELPQRIARSVDRYRVSLDQQRRVQLYSNLHRSAERLLDQLHSIALSENLLHEVLRITGAQVATLITYDYRNQSSIFRGTWQLNRFHFHPLELTDFENELPIYLLSLVLENKEAIAWGNACDEELGLADHYAHVHQVKSIYGAPLMSGKTMLGILILEQRNHYDYFTSEYLDLLRMFCQLAASALENSLLYLSMEQQVSERAQRMMEQRAQIEQNDRTIRESLTLARRIQDSLMPETETLQEYFPDSFVLYQPKYGVSGDFYWFASVQKKQVLVCGDCTGRGVPGAFLSFIAINALNKIIKEYRIIDPARVLTEIDVEIKRVIHRKQSSTGEQLDANVNLMVAVIDRKYMTLEYAGAGQSLYAARGSHVQRLRGDRHPVGGYDDYASSFSQQRFDLQAGDRVYLLTDGVQVQFGGPDGKKFLPKRLRTALAELQDQPMRMQLVHLVRQISQWKGSQEQTDDMTVLGVEIQPISNA